MTHDPLCPFFYDHTGRELVRQTGNPCTYCKLIANVREDERDKQYEAQSENWAKGYAAGLDAAREAVLAYADDTDKHIGMLKCWPENGDRCDITAALRVAAQKIDALREEKK